VVLVQRLADEGPGHRLAARVQLRRRLAGILEHEAGESTLTRWMGRVILPRFVKKRDTSSPRSAIRAMDSAEGAFLL
jgi:hypothetical protein